MPIRGAQRSDCGFLGRFGGRHSTESVPLAQLAERVTFNLKAVGSSPARDFLFGAVVFLLWYMKVGAWRGETMNVGDKRPLESPVFRASNRKSTDFVANVPLVGGMAVRARIDTVEQRLDRGRPVYYVVEPGKESRRLKTEEQLGEGANGTISRLVYADDSKPDPKLVLKEFSDPSEFDFQYGGMSVAADLRECELIAFKTFVDADNKEIEVVLEETDGSADKRLKDDPAGFGTMMTGDFFEFVDTLTACVAAYNAKVDADAGSTVKAYVPDLKLGNVGVINGEDGKRPLFRLIDLDGINYAPGSFSCLLALGSYIDTKNGAAVHDKVLRIESTYAAAATLCEWLADLDSLAVEIDLDIFWFTAVDFKEMVQIGKYNQSRAELAVSLGDRYRRAFSRRVKKMEAIMEALGGNDLFITDSQKEAADRVLTAGIAAVKEAETLIGLCVKQDLRQGNVRQ